MFQMFSIILIKYIGVVLISKFIFARDVANKTSLFCKYLHAACCSYYQVRVFMTCDAMVEASLPAQCGAGRKRNMFGINKNHGTSTAAVSRHPANVGYIDCGRREEGNYRVPINYRLKVYGSEGHKNGANQILILCMFFSTSGHLV